MSTIKVNRIENTSTTDGGVSIDVDGHVTIDGQQMPTAGPLSNRNLIINGAMTVAQRGTSSTATGYGSVDRFAVSHGASGTRTQSQESLTSGNLFNLGFRNFLRITNTTAGSNAATDYVLCIYNVEAQDLAQSGWNYLSSSSYLTLTFWVRASVSMEYFGYLRSDDGTSQVYPFSLGTLTANTWTKITKTIPGDSSLTINNDNGRGMQILINPVLGTNYTDPTRTVETWAPYGAATDRTPEQSNSWNATTGATFDITGVQLEVGSKATPFEHESYGQTLNKCMRYFQMIGNNCMITRNANGVPYTGAPLEGSFVIPRMRAAPTIAASDGTSTITAEFVDTNYGSATNREVRFIVTSGSSSHTVQPNYNFLDNGNVTLGTAFVLARTLEDIYITAEL